MKEEFHELSSAEMRLPSVKVKLGKLSLGSLFQKPSCGIEWITSMPDSYGEESCPDGIFKLQSVQGAKRHRAPPKT